MPHILIIEDEPKVAQFIQRGLLAEGFTADIADTGSKAIQMATEHRYDVMTVDLLIPEYDGYQVIEALRSAQMDAGMLIVSALDRLEDKLKGFRAGADDYLPKPFEFEELVARIQALLKRREGFARNPVVLHYANIELDLGRRSVKRGERSIELTNTEFRLLEYLMRNAQKPCSRSQIAAEVWQESFDRETNIVDVYMMYLRKKIDVPGEPRLIHTVRGVGYVLDEHEGRS